MHDRRNDPIAPPPAPPYPLASEPPRRTDADPQPGPPLDDPLTAPPSPIVGTAPGPVGWYARAFSRYAQFSGRAELREFWWFVLLNAAVGTVLQFVDLVVFGGHMLTLVYSVSALMPGLAVTVRRLHDTEHPGWWLLLALVPIVGAFALLVLLASPGDGAPNRYGPQRRTTCR